MSQIMDSFVVLFSHLPQYCVSTVDTGKSTILGTKYCTVSQNHKNMEINQDKNHQFLSKK